MKVTMTRIDKNPAEDAPKVNEDAKDTTVETDEDKGAERTKEEEPAEAEGESEEGDEAEKGEDEDEPGDGQEYFLKGETEEDEFKDAPRSKDFARMRKALKEKETREAEARAKVLELEGKLKALTRSEEPPDPGNPPKIDDEGIDYDTTKFDAAHADWRGKVEKKKQYEAKRVGQIETHKRSIKALEDSYVAAKAEFVKRPLAEEAEAAAKVYAEAEAAVIKVFSPEKQDAMLKAAKAVGANPARLTYIIGRRPKLLGELANEEDRDLFIAKISNLEANIMERKPKKNKTPPPEETISSTAGTSGDDPVLKKLRADAAVSTDYTLVRKYQREKREKSERRNQGK